MARAISDEELQLKRRARRRLIGAVVLVAAIVVVLPMVLDTEPKPVGRDIAVQIPATSEGGFTGKVQPAAVAPKAGTATGSDSAPAKGDSPAKDAPEKKAVAETSPSPAAPKPAAPKPAAAPAPAKKAASGQFVVQVIALADANRAKQMKERIAAAGIPSYTEIVKTAKGDVTRVRAGPFPTRDAAEKARAQLKTLGMNGNISQR